MLFTHEKANYGLRKTLRDMKLQVILPYSSITSNFICYIRCLVMDFKLHIGFLKIESMIYQNLLKRRENKCN